MRSTSPCASDLLEHVVEIEDVARVGSEVALATRETE